MQVFIGVISCDRAEHTVSSHLPASRAGRLDDAPYSSEENLNDATIIPTPQVYLYMQWRPGRSCSVLMDRVQLLVQ